MMAVAGKTPGDNVSWTFVFRTLSNKSSSRIISRIIPVENKTFCGSCTGGGTRSKRTGVPRSDRSVAELIAPEENKTGVPCRRGPWSSWDFLLDGAGVFPRPSHSTPSLFSKNFFLGFAVSRTRCGPFRYSWIEFAPL